MSGTTLGVVIGLLCVILLGYTVELIVAEVWRDHHPKQPEPRRSLPTSQEIVIENLRTMYLEGRIESDEFEVGLWRAMTGASSPERIAGAEAIAGSLPERDEVFGLMREARVKELTQLHEQQERVQYKLDEVWRDWLVRDNAWVKARGDK